MNGRARGRSPDKGTSSQQDRFGVSAPTISLPKGGSAIRSTPTPSY